MEVENCIGCFLVSQINIETNAYTAVRNSEALEMSEAAFTVMPVGMPIKSAMGVITV